MDGTHHTYHRIYCTSCGKHFDVPTSCGNRFCPVCNYQRKRRVLKSVNFLIAAVSPPSGYSIKFITLTIANQPDLRTMTTEITQSFRRLRSRNYWNNRVRGGAYFIQVTGRPGSWHVHLHILAESRYFPVRRLSALWSKCSTGKIVHIKAIPIRAAVNYVTSYISDTELSAPDALKAGTALRGFRLFQPFGTWHDICGLVPTSGFCCPQCGRGSFYVDKDIRRAFKGQHPAQIAFYSDRQADG